MKNNQNILSTTLGHLAALVSFDTQNPPKAITQDSEIFHYLKKNLEGFQFEFIDAGNGSICLLAQRGQPQLLFNFHIDTVPITNGWSKDPFTLEVSQETATGLGACDIKGASACMLTAVNRAPGDVALLFSSDEEHGSSEAVKAFLAGNKGFKQVVVAEPTQAKAITAHRGIQTAEATFTGKPGHASELRAHNDNAIHRAASWISKSIEWINQQNYQFKSLIGLPFNVGTISGGIKANMIAAESSLKFGFRPLPGQSEDELLDFLAKGILSDEQQYPVAIKKGFNGPSLPAANQNFDEAHRNAEKLSTSLGLSTASPVNFWTEASLFSQSGATAIVYGPGNIEQAHTADEWVALDQLLAVENSYINILNKLSDNSFKL
ncbi:acetylornithine deacetylase [Aliikangiella marina]|uniref:Acetylornithine deacetylase n=1 Tax=Aliikangiella marina TaxID=1712262 RepID=A0A545T2M7_9GAMM|nr:acetylornithine deacetylase [Aliikangiella marina]TQV71470.1 acetylornithine deacetylase [Aliikangiella marina]